ncbi:hypothetical protein B0H67DRAFT_644387 [Lasiosphaeris hirsuta]|uniref:DUF6594 domain-containing protein n=1 Tax=Lasiosphaeris hirsuta TaxID=260670 RepID=A0AA40AES7_9PEZI|nr:hypothetical protein B0H67DRAFT_644387 [Lasiosphaeris hirsuta]
MSSVASSSVPSSPLSERSRSSHQTQGSANTTAPLLPGNLDRRLTQTHSVSLNGLEEATTSHEPPTPGWSLEDADKGAPCGWPSLATCMAKNPAAQSFDRFREANIKNLLYYQVQISVLETDLKTQEGLDWGVSRNMDPGRRFACYADRMIREDSPQWKRVIALRECLQQYNRALIEFSQVSAMPEPSKINVQALFGWLTDQDSGGCNVNGLGSDAWGDQSKNLQLQHPYVLFRALLRSIFVFWKSPPARTDCRLVVPRLSSTVDGLTGWVADVWTPFWVSFKEYCKDPKQYSQNGPESGSAGIAVSILTQQKEKKKNRFETHSEKNMLRFTSAIATIVACLLPTLAISILTTARGMTETLLYIGGFTTLFSIGLMILATETSRVQIFTATAAFSAVLVVFVQNQQSTA